MAYIPETINAMSELDDLDKRKKRKWWKKLRPKIRIKIKNPINFAIKVGMAIATGGTSAIKDIGASAVQKLRKGAFKAISKAKIRRRRRTASAEPTIAPESGIPTTAPESGIPISQATYRDAPVSKTMGLPKNVLLYGGVGLGALLLTLVLTSRKN